MQIWEICKKKHWKHIIHKDSNLKISKFDCIEEPESNKLNLVLKRLLPMAFFILLKWILNNYFVQFSVKRHSFIWFTIQKTQLLFAKISLNRFFYSKNRSLVYSFFLQAKQASRPASRRSPKPVSRTRNSTARRRRRARRRKLVEKYLEHKCGFHWNESALPDFGGIYVRSN